MKKFCMLWLMLVFFRGFSLFPQNSTSLYTREAQPLPPEKIMYNQALSEALHMQLKADSFARIARDKKILASAIPDTSMIHKLANEILMAVREAERYQDQADRLFAKAREIKETEISRAKRVDTVLSLYRTINDIKVYQYNKNVSVASGRMPEHADRTEAAAKAKSVVSDNTVKKESVNTDDFVILEESPYNEGNPFPEGLTLIPGLIYRIQLGVFSSPVPFDAFKGICPVYFERIADGGILKYYAGLFFSLENVTAALEKVRTIGFPDVFIVAFLDGNPISTEKAREIEYAQYKL